MGNLKCFLQNQTSDHSNSNFDGQKFNENKIETKENTNTEEEELCEWNTEAETMQSVPRKPIGKGN